MSNKVSGGCLCGNIRFETTAEPIAPILCHCTDCQTVSGSAFYTAYIVPLDTVELIRGEPAQFDIKAESGRINSRRFCRDCGSRVWAELPEMGMASVNGMALDDRDHFQPVANHRPDSAPAWCQINQSLALFPPAES